MSKSDVLFDLIKSLTAHEKRYFKVYASRHVIGSENNYVKLFDALSSQKKYDERKLKKKIAGKRFADYLPMAKNYLQRIILKSLDNFHLDNTIESRVRTMLRQAKILYEKKMITVCGSVLNRAEKISRKHELDYCFLEILDMKFQLMRTNSYINISQQEINVLFTELLNTIRKIENTRKR